MTSSNLTAPVVTQIPLDSQTISRELIVGSARPPWIRPARKKNLSAPRSPGGVESPPLDTAEFTGNPIPTAPASTLFNLAADFSPIAPTQSHPDIFAGTESSSGQLDPGGAGGLELPVPSAELLAFFEDGSLDVTALLSPSVLPECTTDRPSHTPYGEELPRRGSQGSDELSGLITSP
jgi:hypothetical protein